MDDDVELMLQVKEDNLSAFEKLYLRYQQPLANFFYRLGSSSDIAEDYVQEVFLRLWRCRSTYSPSAKFTTFLFQIAKNYWLNESDKKKRRPSTHSISSSEEEIVQMEIPAETKTPQEQIITEELQTKVQEAIQSLDEKHRIVFILSEVQGMKYREIAEILEIPIGTVKSRMTLAEQKLRAKLKPYFDGFHLHSEETSHELP